MSRIPSDDESGGGEPLDWDAPDRAFGQDDDEGHEDREEDDDDEDDPDYRDEPDEDDEFHGIVFHHALLDLKQWLAIDY